MKNTISSFLLLLFLCVFNVMPVQAVRYQGDPAEAPKIENLLKVLSVQQQELEKLMGFLSRLDDWKNKLSAENQRLAQEGELASQDRKKFEDGNMTEEELNKKWHISGRSIKHDQAQRSFKEDVAGFNAYVKEYNLLTRKMAHVLDKRTPSEVVALIKNMRKLVGNLREAMMDGNIEKAGYIARQSDIAAEFGYSKE